MLRLKMILRHRLLLNLYLIQHHRLMTLRHRLLLNLKLILLRPLTRSLLPRENCWFRNSTR